MYLQNHILSHNALGNAVSHLAISCILKAGIRFIISALSHTLVSICICLFYNNVNMLQTKSSNANKMAKYLGAYLLNAIGGEGTDEASLKKTLESAGIEVDSAMVRYFFF